MYSFSNVFNKISFKTKLLLSYIILITIPITESAILIYNQIFASFTEKSSVMIEQRLNQEVKNIHTALDTIEKIGFNISSNRTLALFLWRKYSDRSNDFYINITNKILPIFSCFKSINPYISKFNILTYNETISEVNVFNQASKFENESWFLNIKKNTALGLPFWENYHIQREYRNLHIEVNPKYPVYSLFYMINPGIKPNTGYLEIEVNPRLIFESINNTPIGKSGYLDVINDRRDILLNKEDAKLKNLMQDDIFLSKLKQSKGKHTIMFNKVKYNISYQKINRLNSFIISIIPESEITELFVAPKRNFIITIGITFIFLLILALSLGNLLAKKIHKITDAIHTLETGDFNAQIAIKGNDELDKLCKDFNKMANRINELVNIVYKAEVAQKQAELFALQAQIKPHFIYNTLESLKMLAELHDEEEISDGLTALGNLMRQNNTIGKNLISIYTEIENLMDYIKIQNLNYNNKIKIEFNIPDNIKSYKILSLILQPLIENCIVHGLGDNQYWLNILIEGTVTNGNLYFYINDNGKGIEKNKLIKIKEIMNKESIDAVNPDGKGVGLVNVHKRIKLFFGNNYGISINNNTEKGTNITVKIPLLP